MTYSVSALLLLCHLLPELSDLAAIPKESIPPMIPVVPQRTPLMSQH